MPTPALSRIALAMAVGAFLLATTAFAVEGAAAPALKLHPPGTHTGIARVDRVLDAFDSGDPRQLAALIRPLKVRCVLKPENQIPSRPVCKRGEPKGTRVDVYWAAACEGYYMRVEDAKPQLRAFHKLSRGLYAVYRMPEEGPFGPFTPRGGFAIVFAAGEGRSLVGMQLVLGPRGPIWSISTGCSDTPQRLLRTRAGEIVLPPAQ